MEKVTIGVHRRTDTGACGFVVRITVDGPDWQRVAKFPVNEKAEAVALARSIKNYVDVGLPIDSLVPDEAFQSA